MDTNLTDHGRASNCEVNVISSHTAGQARPLDPILFMQGQSVVFSRARHFRYGDGILQLVCSYSEVALNRPVAEDDVACL